MAVHVPRRNQWRRKVRQSVATATTSSVSQSLRKEFEAAKRKLTETYGRRANEHVCISPTDNKIIKDNILYTASLGIAEFGRFERFLTDLFLELPSYLERALNDATDALIPRSAPR